MKEWNIICNEGKLTLHKNQFTWEYSDGTFIYTIISHDDGILIDVYESDGANLWRIPLHNQKYVLYGKDSMLFIYSINTGTYNTVQVVQSTEPEEQVILLQVNNALIEPEDIVSDSERLPLTSLRDELDMIWYAINDIQARLGY